MFGDIGSDIAAKLTGGVGLVSSNNTNPNNPRAVSMFETMGGTADDIAGQDKANPVALIDAAAEMLLHIGGLPRLRAAELIKTAVLEVLAEGYFVGDIQRGPFQVSKGRERSGTRAFTAEIVKKMSELRALKDTVPTRTFKELALARAEAVGVAGQTADVSDFVAGLVAGAETRAADVDRVSAVVDGLDADVGIACRGQEFEMGSRHRGSGSSSPKAGIVHQRWPGPAPPRSAGLLGPPVARRVAGRIDAVGAAHDDTERAARRRVDARLHERGLRDRRGELAGAVESPSASLVERG
jgi:hypothetical protein